MTLALGRFSITSCVVGLAFLEGASDGVVIVLGSSLGELGVFEEEFLRWCSCAGDRFGEPAIRAWDVLAPAAQDKHVQVPLRASSFEYRDNMLLCLIKSYGMLGHLVRCHRL